MCVFARVSLCVSVLVHVCVFFGNMKSTSSTLNRGGSFALMVNKQCHSLNGHSVIVFVLRVVKQVKNRWKRLLYDHGYSNRIVAFGCIIFCFFLSVHCSIWSSTCTDHARVRKRLVRKGCSAEQLMSAVCTAVFSGQFFYRPRPVVAGSRYAVCSVHRMC